MRLLFRTLFPFALLIINAPGAWAATNDVVVNVEAMIGEATLVSESADGKQESIIVPTGKTTQKDPNTGQTLLAPATEPNKVNEVVQAIAASAPDADNQQPSEDGCNQGNAPHRLVARPEFDEALAAAIEKELEGMSSGELMMVMAVLINNAKHLCIDTATVVNTVALIATARPEEAGNVAYVAALLDPANSDLYINTAVAAAPTQIGNIRKKEEELTPLPPKPKPKPKPAPKPPIERERDIPPGGSIGEPPSPE